MKGGGVGRGKVRKKVGKGIRMRGKGGWAGSRWAKGRKGGGAEKGMEMRSNETMRQREIGEARVQGGNHHDLTAAKRERKAQENIMTRDEAAWQAAIVATVWVKA